MDRVMAQSRSTTLIPLLLIGLLFFIFGFLTWLNGALIPFLQLVCQLSSGQALFVAFSFYIAYTVMALPMARVLEKTGYKKGMSLGLGLIALGALLFVPAALTQEFAIFLLAQFVVGSGLTILQTASNPYLVHVGPAHSAAARIALMGLLNKAAGVVAPLIFTALVLADLEHVDAAFLDSLNEAARQQQIEALAHGLIGPYVGMAVALLLLALGLRFSPLPELALNTEDETDNGSVWQQPQLVYGVISLFLYVGAEVVAGDTIGLLGMKLGVAGATTLTSYTMAFMVLGYILGLVLIPRYLSQARALLLSALLGGMLTLAIVLASKDSQTLSLLLWGWAGGPLLPDPVVLVAMLGFANAIVWPAIWPLALADLGRHTAKGSALLIMAIAGGAVLPLIYGGLADHFGVQPAYLLLLPCYAMIGWYAAKGHKKRYSSRAS